MKRFFALLMALTVALSLTACGGSGSEPSSAEPSITEPTEEENTDVSSTIGDVVELEPSDDEPENLPAGETAGDAAGQPAGEKPGDAQTVKPGSGTSSGSGSGTSSGSGNSQSKPAPKPETPPVTETPSEPAAPEKTEKSLSELMTSILEGVDTPNYAITELSAEMYPMYLFVEQPEGAEAVTADALIGSIAHSVVLMRLPDGADVSGIAKQVEDNADPRKWICVEAEKTVVKTKGDLVLLVMSDAAAADAIAANFDALSL